MYKTIVLVTDQFECERIIRAARVVADLSQTELSVLSVVRSTSPVNPVALEHLFKVSRENRGVMTISYSDDILKSIISSIKWQRTLNVITGMPEGDDSILYKIWQKFTHIAFFTVNSDGELKEINRMEYAARG